MAVFLDLLQAHNILAAQLQQIRSVMSLWGLDTSLQGAGISLPETEASETLGIVGDDDGHFLACMKKNFECTSFLRPQIFTVQHAKIYQTLLSFLFPYTWKKKNLLMLFSTWSIVQLGRFLPKMFSLRMLIIFCWYCRSISSADCRSHVYLSNYSGSIVSIHIKWGYELSIPDVGGEKKTKT